MRYVIRACAAVLGLAAAAPAHGQDYAQQVWEQLQAMRSNFQDYALQNYVIGHISEGVTDSWTLTLDEGSEYVIAGACDADCSDLDIIVRNAKGTEIAKDDTEDDVPVATFTTGADGGYTIQARMYACAASTCYFGFGVFRRSSGQ